MPVAIVVNQAGKPPGQPGKAREDLATGVNVVLTLTGGPYSDVAWSLVDAPTSADLTTLSSATAATPTQASTIVTPIDNPGTYKVEVVVDSGLGLGASEDDRATITFYAGPPLAQDPAELPIRVPSFFERTEHNAPTPARPAGNQVGWKYFIDALVAVVTRIYQGKSWATGVFDATGGQVDLTMRFNVDDVSRSAVGVYDVTMKRPVPTPYAVTFGFQHGGSATRATYDINDEYGFTIRTYNGSNAAADGIVAFDVKGAPPL